MGLSKSSFIMKSFVNQLCFLWLFIGYTMFNKEDLFNPTEQIFLIEQTTKRLTAFSLAISHSDPYIHNTLLTHPLLFFRTVR